MDELLNDILIKHMALKRVKREYYEDRRRYRDVNKLTPLPPLDPPIEEYDIYDRKAQEKENVLMLDKMKLFQV